MNLMKLSAFFLYATKNKKSAPYIHHQTILSGIATMFLIEASITYRTFNYWAAVRSNDDDL